LRALVKLELECEVDDVNGDSEHVWAKIREEDRQRLYMVHKSKVTYPKEEQQKLESGLTK